MSAFKLAFLAYFSRLWYTLIAGVASGLFFFLILAIFGIIDYIVLK